MNGERLTAVDATYLSAEEPRLPLHVASIGIFEGAPLLDERGAIRLDELCARIEPRLGLLPRLRQRIAEVPFGAGRPVWVDDEHFDISNHLDVVALPPPGDEDALLRLAEATVMEPLDRRHPLWHVRLVTGLAEGKVAIIQRAHHAMVDGVSGVDVSLVLLDAVPDAPPSDPDGWSPQRPPSALSLLVDALYDRVAAPVSAVTHAAAALRDPAAVARGAARVVSAARVLGRDGMRAPHTSLNAPVTASRRLSVVRARLDDVRAAGASRGSTVNDVVLTAVAGGMRALLLARGDAVRSDVAVKALVPVSLRDASQVMTLGNRVGALVVPLPVGIADPDQVLAAVTATTKALKASTEAVTTDVLLRVADVLPPEIGRLLGRVAVHHQPFVNLIVTNVPGPPFPLYALGARMLEAIPIVPLGGNLPLEVAILSYDGALVISVTSDRTACADVDAFVDGMVLTLDALQATRSAAREPEGVQHTTDPARVASPVG